MATAFQSYPSWLAHEERLAGRQPAGVAGEVDGHPAELVDASVLGCRVRTVAPGGVGAFLTLAAGSAEARVVVGGWVVWRRGEVLGLDFARALEPEQLAVLIGGTSTE